jgi:signal transduction histidine kinase
MMDINDEKAFREFKKQYYIEQTYNLSFIFANNVTESLDDRANDTFFDDISTRFSTAIEIMDEEQDNVIYHHFPETVKQAGDFFVDAPIIENGKLLGYLRAYYDLDNQVASPAITTFEKVHAKQRLHIMELTFILLVTGSYIVAKLFSNPVKVVSDSARQVLNGDRELLVPKKGTLEMEQLAESVNALLIEFKNMENWRKQLLEDLTHELRTPITSVLTTMEAIVDGVYPSSKEVIADIYGQVDRLSRLIVNVQNLSEAESAQFTLHTKRIDIIDLVRGVYEGFQFVAKQKDIQLNLNYPNRPFKAVVDPDRYTQVITNIISNALRYTEERGTVEIGLEDVKEALIFYCSDNGIGISEEKQALVFNRFYRAEPSRSRENGGSGIGLNISNALAKAHGGSIHLESEYGVGSTFWFTIPVNSDGSELQNTEGNHGVK